MSPAIGRPIDRVDGRAKVTGAAKYTAEVSLPDLAYAAVVGATIPSGRVVAVDTASARAAGGVVTVLTHQNLSRIAGQPHLLPSLGCGPAPGESFFPMQDDAVHYAGQPIVLVIADSQESAHYAASLVVVTYAPSPSITTIDEGRGSTYEAERLFGGLMPGRLERGDVEAGLADAEVRLDAEFHFAANQGLLAITLAGHRRGRSGGSGTHSKRRPPPLPGMAAV